MSGFFFFFAIFLIFSIVFFSIVFFSIIFIVVCWAEPPLPAFSPSCSGQGCDAPCASVRGSPCASHLWTEAPAAAVAAAGATGAAVPCLRLRA